MFSFYLNNIEKEVDGDFTRMPQAIMKKTMESTSYEKNS